MIIDTHCHLNDKELYKSRKELVKKAILLGVKKMICVGFDYPSSKMAVQIAHEFPGVVYAAVGIHPSESITSEIDDYKGIEKLIQDKFVIAVGEIGLDYHYDDVPKIIQKDCFERQIKLAHLYKKPIIIHMRDATKDTLEIFKHNKEFIQNSGIIHCYSASAESVDSFLNYGFYLSFGGPLTFLNAKAPKEAIKKVPLDRLLFETDSPYLAPHPFRGQTNEPSNVKLVLQEASRILKVSEKELEQQEEENVRTLFKI